MPALEYLCILLGAAPNEIRLPPKCFKRGSESVAIIREAAQAVLAARSALPSSQVDPWEWVVGRAPPNVPPPGHYPAPPPFARPRCPPFAGNAALREEEVVSELLTWRQPKGGGFIVSSLPAWQRDFLATNVAPSGLWALLERHPRRFVVDRATSSWWFADASVSATSHGVAGAPLWLKLFWLNFARVSCVAVLVREPQKQAVNPKRTCN